jgi:hypothetical protein
MFVSFVRLLLLLALLAPVAVRSQPVFRGVFVFEATLPTQDLVSTVSVQGVGTLRAKEVRIFVHHVPALKVVSPRCVGTFTEGVPLVPVVKKGGTLIGCLLLSGTTARPAGPVMQFTLKGTPTFER